MCAEFLKHADGNQRVCAALADGMPDFFRLSHLFVKVDLEGRRSTKYDVLVFDGYLLKTALSFSTTAQKVGGAYSTLSADHWFV